MNAFVRARETRQPGLMPDQDAPARRRSRQRPRRRRPRAAGVIIANEQRLAAMIDHRIVRERRQPVLAAVLGPRRRRSARAQDRAEPRVGDDVDPRRRRLLIAFEDDRVGAAVVRESADAVRHGQRRQADVQAGLCGRRMQRRPDARAPAAARRQSAFAAAAPGARADRRDRFRAPPGPPHRTARARRGPWCRRASRNAPPAGASTCATALRRAGP